MTEEQSTINAKLEHSAKQKALMKETIATKRHSTKQMESRTSMKRHSTKQMALMEERISSWNMNGSVPILTFAGRGEYLSKIYNQLLTPDFM